MMRSIFIAAALWILTATPGKAAEVRFVLAGAAEGRVILSTPDAYLKGLSVFDRAAKPQTEKPLSEQDFITFAAAQALEWTDAERAALRPVLRDLAPRVNAFNLDWPDTVVFVHTTGREEADAAYTRGNAIFLPRDVFSEEKRDELKRLVAHELFHVFSRHNAKLREKLYAIIGYQPCGAVPFPSKLKDLRINNPDAPENEYCIRVSAGGKPAWVTPILFAREPYDVGKGGTFFNYLELKFLKVDGDGPQPPKPARYDDANPQLLDVAQMSGFTEQIGKNTGYIIHPEETLADNFALMLLDKNDVPSPDIIARLRTVLSETAR